MIFRKRFNRASNVLTMKAGRSKAGSKNGDKLSVKQKNGEKALGSSLRRKILRWKELLRYNGVEDLHTKVTEFVRDKDCLVCGPGILIQLDTSVTLKKVLVSLVGTCGSKSRHRSRESFRAEFKEYNSGITNQPSGVHLYCGHCYFLG